MMIKHFDAQQFLQEYWQKKPCVIKSFVSHFTDPIDENDLAGLAQESDVDCRIVAKSTNNGEEEWQVAQGPFEDFEPQCKGDWSLLVQGVDRYIPEIDQLAKLVNFIPNWRFDDVMVSYSVPNAGVGPHTDQYDVFIIQGKGSRRWQVGLPLSQGQETPITPHPLLKQIKGFDPIIDEVLEAGDAVYIPPKHPHNGVALTECLNYSIGFRAPTNLEVLAGMLDESDHFVQSQVRYTDPNIDTLRASGKSENQAYLSQVSPKELAQLKDNIMALLHSEQSEHAILQYLSRQSLPDLQAGEDYTVEDVIELSASGVYLLRAPGVRPIHAETSSAFFTFYIDGNHFDLPVSLSNYMQTILNADGFLLSTRQMQSELQNDKDINALITLITQLLNMGYWEIEDDE
jgi:50S ribosomal protein L16 3-hydroxylase